MTHACTIIARNYLAYVRVLVDSFLAFHPDGTFTVLVIDGQREPPTDGGRVVWLGLSDLGLDTRELHQLAAIYDVTELSTAIKPIFLGQLLDGGCGEVVFLDPDIAIYASLDDLPGLARQHGIVLTPHTTVPLPDDGRGVDAFFILAAGIYNLGFIAISDAVRPFLEWWWRHLRRHALNDVSHMMFTDQRVLDFLPAFYAPFLLKDPGYNVAYWNLHAREITVHGADVRVNGVPLRFFHFSGFDVDRPWLLSKNQGSRPRILLSERPDVRRLCDDYAQRVIAARDRTRPPYGWHTTPSGLVLTTRMRRLYRAAVIEAEQAGTPVPPDPFDPQDGGAFLAWLNDPDPGGPASLSRYLHSIYQDRVDLQVYFRDIHGADAGRFVDWLWRVGIAPEVVPPELLPVASAASALALVPGLDLIVDADDQVARLVGGGLEAGARAAGVACASRASAIRSSAGPAENGYEVLLLCCSPARTAALLAATGALVGRTVVGYWLFQDLPHGDVAFDLVDEIWVASESVAAVLREVSPTPVFVVPVLPVAGRPSSPDLKVGPTRSSPIVEGAANAAGVGPTFRSGDARGGMLEDARDGKAAGVGPTFRSGASVDAVAPALTDRSPDLKVGPTRAGARFFQVVGGIDDPEPVNVHGTITAFTRAFPVQGPADLTILVQGGDAALREIERLRFLARARTDVSIVRCADGLADGAGYDVYVSLHRSGGDALTIAAMMAQGLPVVATADPANLSPMTNENSYPVDAAAAASGGVEPDLDRAAAQMRAIRDNPEEAAARGARARAEVQLARGERATAERLRERMGAIRERRTRLALVPAVAVAKEAPLSIDAKRALDPPAGSSIEAILPQLESLATPHVADGAASGGLRSLAQRLLFRILRPYWFQQYQLHKNMIEAFGRVAHATREEAAQRAALDQRVRELTRQVADSAREIRRLEGLVTTPERPPRS